MEARQSGRGFLVLAVLGTSLALVVMVWAAVELWGNYLDPRPENTQQTATISCEPDTRHDRQLNTGRHADRPHRSISHPGVGYWR